VFKNSSYRQLLHEYEVNDQQKNKNHHDDDLVSNSSSSSSLSDLMENDKNEQENENKINVMVENKTTSPPPTIESLSSSNHPLPSSSSILSHQASQIQELKDQLEISIPKHLLEAKGLSFFIKFLSLFFSLSLFHLSFLIY